MSDPADQRQRFAAVLRRRADDRRRSMFGAPATGEDIKIIDLFDRLASQIDALSLEAWRDLQPACDLGLAEPCCAARRDAMLAQVGILYWPTGAADLLSWMGAHAADGVEEDRCSIDGGRPGTGPSASNVAARRCNRVRSSDRQRDRVLSWAADVSGGIGIVAPLLSVWTVRDGLGQMRDRAFADAHESVSATVVSIEPSGSKGSTGQHIVLSFTTPGGETCRVTWHPTLPPFSGGPGDTLQVVARSPACEMPLVIGTIGDPGQTFLTAAGAMVVGFLSLRLWAWLFKHVGPVRHVQVP